MSSDAEQTEVDETDDADFSDVDPFAVDPGRRWTANPDILVIEAQLVADGDILDNPALPMSAETAAAAERRLDRLGVDVEPVWSEIEQYPNLVPEGLYE